MVLLIEIGFVEAAMLSALCILEIHSECKHVPRKILYMWYRDVADMREH